MTRTLLLHLTALGWASAALAQPCEPVWSALGDGVPEQKGWGVSLAVFDDGRGPALYVGSDFRVSDGAAANGIVRWDGHTWSDVGGGLDGEGFVSAVLVFDDGTGPALHIAGLFESVGGIPAHRAAKWDGERWSAVGGDSLALTPLVLAQFDDGTGPALYAGGLYAKDSLVYRLDGDTWSPVGDLTGSGDRWGCFFAPFVIALTAFDDGTGTALYAGGQIWHQDDAYSVAGLARWNGHEWGEVGGPFLPTADCLHALAVYGGSLYVGDAYDEMQRWDGAQWSAMPGTAGVLSMLSTTDALGPALYIGGRFSKIGGTQAASIARWDGALWSPLSAGLTRAGQPGSALDLSPAWDHSAAVIAAGEFDRAGTLPAANIARWGCPPCPSDCDASGGLDVLDWTCFVNDFNTADPAADCDRSGSLDLFDFLCFINAFNAGCP